jgi:uncharacterized protein
MREEIIELIKQEAEKYFELDGSHGFDHTERVYNMSLHLSEGENIDLDVIKVSALLHDIARHKEAKDENICHAIEGAKMAKDILERHNFPKEKIEKIVHCILVHRYSKQLKPESKEAEILQDSDRLDALGAICIARVFGYSGKKDRPFHIPSIPPKKEYNGESETSINHFFEKILKIKPEGFHTEKAKKIAKERYKFIEEFVKRFILEWEGKL